MIFIPYSVIVKNFNLNISDFYDLFYIFVLSGKGTSAKIMERKASCEISFVFYDGPVLKILSHFEKLEY